MPELLLTSLVEDIYDGQFLVGTQANVDVTIHKQIQPGKVYIIDFGSSRRLEQGPGYQHALELPETNCKPPLHMSRFDPYSWDIYCTDKFFKSLAEVNPTPLPIEQLTLNHNSESL